MIIFKATSLKEKNEKERAVEALENALCELDEANAQRMAAIEDALCELDINDVGDIGDMGGNV